MAPNDEEWLKFFHILSDLPFSSRKFNICRSSILGSNFIFRWFRECWCRTSLEKRKIKFEPRVRFYNIRLERKARKIKPWKFSHRTLHNFTRNSRLLSSKLRHDFGNHWKVYGNFLSQIALGIIGSMLSTSFPKHQAKRLTGRKAHFPPRPASPLFRRLNVQQGPTVRASTFESFSVKVR